MLSADTAARILLARSCSLEQVLSSATLAICAPGSKQPQNSSPAAGLAAAASRGRRRRKPAPAREGSSAWWSESAVESCSQRGVLSVTWTSSLLSAREVG